MFMSKFFTLFALLLFSNVFVFSQAEPPETDFQIWNDTTVTIPLIKTTDSAGKETEKLNLLINGTLRFGGNATRFADERIGFGFEIPVNKYLTLTPNYLYRAGQPYKGRKEYEHRVRFDATIGKKWSKFSLRDRNRIEYRIRNSGSDSVRYRNRLTLSVPVVKDKKELFAPFVATEPFYDFKAKQWTRNEFSAGISKTFTDNYSADFYYLLQNNRGNVLRKLNVFGINFKIKID